MVLFNYRKREVEMKKKRILSILVGLIVVIAVMVIGLLINTKPLHNSDQGQKDSEFKIGYIIDGSKDDNQIYTSAYNGILNLRTEMNAYFSMRENIDLDQLENNIENYTKDQFDIIILGGDEYEETIKEIAEKYPETDFVVLNSKISNNKNLSSLNIDLRTAGFIRGMLAGYITKRNVVAAIGYTDDKPTIQELYGFEMGVSYINADIQVYGEYVTKREGKIGAGDLLKEFASYGADVVISGTGIYDNEVFEVAENNKIYALGNNNNLMEKYPETMIAVCSFNVTRGVEDMIRMTYDKGFMGESIEIEFDLEYNEGLKARISAGGLSKVEQTLNDLRSGKLKIDELVPME
jgi:basic membrane protein A and related proteins